MGESVPGRGESPGRGMGMSLHGRDGGGWFKGVGLEAASNQGPEWAMEGMECKDVGSGVAESMWSRR